MNYSCYLPEGRNLYTQENLLCTSSILGLERAMRGGRILEGRVVLCDGDLDLHVELGEIEGIIPREECVLCGEGESVKDIAIISRVGKPVCFKVLALDTSGATPRAILSRRAAQAECRSLYLNSLLPGDIIPATVTHLDTFGAFVDIGCGICSLLSIDCISVSRISHPSDRLGVGAQLSVAVRSNDLQTGRIYVTLKELLGTWQENARGFCTGQTVSGVVRSIEEYGVFVELTPNLAGLAEPRSDDPTLRDVRVGDGVSVYIKSIIPEKMKIKLVLIDYAPCPTTGELKYYVNPTQITHLDRWQYSPIDCPKIVETMF